MNKQQYKVAHRLVRLLRYEQQLLSTFHYPVGFDCWCRGADECESCGNESAGRSAAAEALTLIKAEIDKLLAVVDRQNLPLVATTLKPNYTVFQTHCKIGWWFHHMLITQPVTGKRGMSALNRRGLVEWLPRVDARYHEDKMIQMDICEMEYALANHHRVEQYIT